MYGTDFDQFFAQFNGQFRNRQDRKVIEGFQAEPGGLLIAAGCFTQYKF